MPVPVPGGHGWPDRQYDDRANENDDVLACGVGRQVPRVCL